MTTVPDVVGLEKQTAEYDIAAANLKVRNVRTKRDDHRAGVVIDQDPRPGKSVQVGSPVDLVVSSGTPATIHTLYVDPASKTIEMKDKLPLKALLWHTDGSEKDVTEKATWTGADSTGVFTPTKPGKFQITASFSGFSGSATITVREPLPSQWSSPISHADDRTPHSTEPPPDAYTYFVFCHPDKGEVVYGEYPQIQDKIMAGPFPGPRNAQFWIEQNCPRWRCTAEGACAKEPAYVSGGQWAVVCDKNDLHVYTTKSPPDLTRYWIMQQGLLGGPDADLWIQKYCPTRLCIDGGGCAKADVPRKGGKWAVVCDKNTGSVALTEYPDAVRKWIWVDNLFGEPDARLWANQNCPSWRCNRDGKCLPGNPPLESASGRSLELPPDFSNIGNRYRAAGERRDREVRDRSAADASRYGTGLTTSPQATTNDQTTPTSGGTTTPTTPGVTSPTTPPTGGTGPTTPTKGGTSQTPTGGTGPTGVTSTGTPTTPGQFPEKKRYYIVKKTASGIWQWKNYKCTENIYDVIITQDQNAQQDINAARRKWDEDNQKCKQKGCNRGALYTRMWWPQTWSFSIYQGPLDKPPALDKIPKNDQKCTGEMR